MSGRTGERIDYEYWKFCRKRTSECSWRNVRKKASYQDRYDRTHNGERNIERAVGALITFSHLQRTELEYFWCDYPDDSFTPAGSRKITFHER